MHGTKRLHDTDGVSRHHESLALAATELAWAVALATTRTAVASTVRGFELWSLVLRGPAVPPRWSLLAAPVGWQRSGWCQNLPGTPGAFDTPSASGAPDALARPFPAAREPLASADHAPPIGGTDAPADAGTFAVYRSSSGHAAAQVSRRD